MNINKLLSAKWLISILTTLVFCYLSIVQTISAEQFMTVFVMVVGFYFGQSVGSKNKI